MTTKKRDKHLLRAIRQAGGPTKLATHLRRWRPITTQAISQWRRCPYDRVLHVASAPGVKVTRHCLRPDIYPTPK